MTNDEMKDAQRSFNNLRKSVNELEAVFQKLFAGLAEIDHRLEILERKRRQTVFRHFNGSEGSLPPGFVDAQ